ncbi:MAG: hypothetical protein E6J10_04120 [Chloroflexi bacterium]|nr:MAG: hypothetical protein E6J10_04120 [Chloroflexota bacterium]
MATKVQSSRQNAWRRIWHTPTSKAALYWLIFAAIYTAIFYVLYAVLFKAPIFTGPWFDHVFRVGVMSYLLILATAAYSLRTRFVRGLPWKTQNWVWMHLWIGIAAVLLALLHADYRFVLHGYCADLSCVTGHYWGMPALYGLMFIVVSGAAGRLLDIWQARLIARDASANGVGIAKAIPGRLLELEYIIERLNAGKSEPFKHYCIQAMSSVGKLSMPIPTIEPREQADFEQAHAALEDHARLAASFKKQNRARSIFRVWRRVHMMLVPLMLLIVTYHAVLELIVNVLHLAKP